MFLCLAVFVGSVSVLGSKVEEEEEEDEEKHKDRLPTGLQLAEKKIPRVGLQLAPQ